jgi:hypothetical protein
MSVRQACRGVKRSIVGTLKATWIDHETGAFSVPHFASILAVMVLSAAFMKNVWQHQVDGLDYIYYAVAMSASASPSLMHKVIALRFGSSTPTEEKK